MKFFAFLFSLMFILSGSAACSAQKQEMPLGVYLSWELAHAYSNLNGIPLEEFLDNALQECHKRNFNTLWVTNIDAGDLSILQKPCEKYGITLLANSCEGKADVYYADNAALLRGTVKRMQDAAFDKLAYWVISDEPEKSHVENLNLYAGILRESGMEQGTALVVTAAMIDNIIGHVPLSMAAVDPYPFFGPDDPNGPHTRMASQAHFRNNSMRFVEACRKAGTEPWLMPQSFAEVWGPYEYTAQGELIALPGAYLHWITPTVTETRWQLFESIRLGAQGVVFFQLFPTMLPQNGSLPMPDVPWKDVLMQTPVSAGYAALLTIHGKPAPQMDELGKWYPLLQKNADILCDSVPHPAAEWTKNLPANVSFSTFKAENNTVYTVVVNDDFDIQAELNIAGYGLYDLLQGLPVTEPCLLPPGGGCILAEAHK